MPANYLHGVETIEFLVGSRPVREVKSAVIGIVGTAPIFKVAVEDQKINTCQLILTDRDAAKYFAYSDSTFDYTIPEALDAIFDQGGATIIVVNVFDPATHKTDVAATNFTFADNKIQLKSGNTKHEGITNLIVTNVAGSTTYVLDTDYSVNTASGAIARITSGAIPNNATVKCAYTFADPTKVTNGDIIGGTNLAGVRTGMQAWRDSYSRFGFFPKILIAPVYSSQVAITAELEIIANKLRAIDIVDAPIGTTFQQAIEGRGTEGAINFNTSDMRSLLCYPHVKVYDKATDSNRLAPYSSRIAGAIAAKDKELGYWYSVSNTQIRGIVDTERAITAAINDPDSEANLLNEVGIVTIFNDFGTGYRIWGNRSAAWPSNTHPINFINIRRTADIAHESLERSMLQFLDKPITQAVIAEVTESANNFFKVLISRGAIKEGSNCKFDPSKNPSSQIALGQLIWDLTFIGNPPLERITFESFIDTNLLTLSAAA